MNRIRKFAIVAATAAVGLWSTSAWSADYLKSNAWSGSWYVEALAGFALPIDHDMSFAGIPGEYDPDNGFTLAAAIGQHVTPNWRVELGVSWTRANDGTVVLAGPVVVPHTGHIDVITVLLNALYEFDTTWIGRPFLGVGLGIAHYNLNNFGGGAPFYNDSDTTFAGALHAGVEIPVGDSVSLTGRYSLVATGSADFTNGVTPATKESNVDHVFLFGLHVDLN